MKSKKGIFNNWIKNQNGDLSTPVRLSLYLFRCELLCLQTEFFLL